MTCHLFGVKPFPEPMVTYCSLDIWINCMKVYDISHLLPISDMWCLVALWMPSHFMNQCRHIVQWTSLNKLYVSIWYKSFIAYVWHCRGLYWGLLPFELVKIDTYDGLSPDRWQAITWTKADLLFIDTFWTTQALLCWNYCSLILSEQLRLYFVETITIVICFIN